MALLNILHHPDPRLRIQATPVEKVDDSIRRIVDDMLETMYSSKGIGLAAVQVNIHQQIIVMDVSEERDLPICLINPRILSRDGHIALEEGCLSVPEIYEPVVRSSHIVVEALDRDGSLRTLEAEDLQAVCIQHEMDHLRGKLFIDHLSALKRQRLRKKLEKAQRKAS